jgi:putative acetyltransferase
MSFHLRQSTIEDLAAMQQLFYETVTTINAQDYDSEQIKVWASGIENQERWMEILSSQFIIIAEFNAEIVGFCSLSPTNYIDLLYVHKNFQRLGIAQILFEEIEKEAIKRNIQTLISDVSKTAKLFFEKMGFELIHEQKVLRKGIELINFKMIKKISP